MASGRNATAPHRQMQPGSVSGSLSGNIGPQSLTNPPLSGPVRPPRRVPPSPGGLWEREAARRGSRFPESPGPAARGRPVGVGPVGPVGPVSRATWSASASHGDRDPLQVTARPAVRGTWSGSPSHGNTDPLQVARCGRPVAKHGGCPAGRPRERTGPPLRIARQRAGRAGRMSPVRPVRPVSRYGRSSACAGTNNRPRRLSSLCG